jgi:hypothetical protein
MGRLFLPPRVARELLEERRQFAGAIDRETYKDEVCHRWDKELSRLDPLLEMVRARDCFVVGTPLLPGHYHVIRRNEGAPPSVIPIRGPEGFIYPPGRLLEQLKTMDLQDARVERMRERVQRSLEERAERDRERVREERQREILERWWATSRTQVSMNPDVPWHQNAAGRRGARPKAKEA